MAVGIEQAGESYGLLVDQVGEVVKLPVSKLDPVPANLDPAWTRLAAGVHRLDHRLMVVLDVDRSLETRQEMAAA